MPADVSAITALANVTLGASASTVTFSSISGSYRDLVIVIQAKNSVGSSGLRARFNSDIGANYSFVLIDGNGSTAASTSGATDDLLQIGGIGTDDSQQIIQVMDYSATDKHKACLTRADRAGSSTTAFANRWASTSAVTTIMFFPTANQFAAGSSFALYGVSSS